MAESRGVLAWAVTRPSGQLGRMRVQHLRKWRAPTSHAGPFLNILIIFLLSLREISQPFSQISLYLLEPPAPEGLPV
jgi:hypothetical protein